MEAGDLSCEDLAKTLLKRLRDDEKDCNQADGPDFRGFAPSKSAILNASEIRERESLVWPRTDD